MSEPIIPDEAVLRDARGADQAESPDGVYIAKYGTPVSAEPAWTVVGGASNIPSQAELARLRGADQADERGRVMPNRYALQREIQYAITRLRQDQLEALVAAVQRMVDCYTTDIQGYIDGSRLVAQLITARGVRNGVEISITGETSGGGVGSWIFTGSRPATEPIILPDGGLKEGVLYRVILQDGCWTAIPAEDQETE